MTGFCKTFVPKDIANTLEGIKDNDEAVKNFGIDLGTKMCKRMLEAGTPGLHMYTLNTERSSVAILENLGLINKSQVRPGTVPIGNLDQGALMWPLHPGCCCCSCIVMFRYASCQKHQLQQSGTNQTASSSHLVMHQADVTQHL